MTSSIAIRDLAEMVHRCGDLYAGGRGRTTGEEGIATQRVLQRKRLDASEHYQREVSVSACVEIAGAQMLLKGRVDGLDLNATPARVEEFKTTRQSAEQAYQRDGVVHFAQLKLYAALLAISHPDHKRFALVVLYCHPETLQVHECVEVLGREALAAFLAQTLEAHGAVLRRYREHVWARDAWVDELTFPYAAYRPHQLAMARRCFTTLRDARSLLIEAPTGSGKTMGVLYPALKSLPATHARRLLFLTSRTTGAAAVHAAVRHIDPASDRLRSVHIIAREAACLVEGMPCDPERCEYARGYYDRREVALDALLAHGMIGAEQTRDIAERYRVCPFELSLDAALWADLLVLDCNYVFDPVVMLQRFAGDENSDLLVDEAHQLAPRVRDMLSAELDLSVIRSARHGAVPGTAIKRLDSIARAMTTLRRLYGHNEIMEVDQPLAVSRACERFMTSWQEEQWPTDLDAALSEALWHVKRWLRAEAWSDEVRFRHVLDTGSKNVSLRLVCLDASRHIRNVFDGFRSHIRFSGTLTPLELYQDQHGFKDDDIERVASAYVSEQL
ncbi:MAG: PD-(D/E)XK nuclease family protein, partial [Pseudomonadales bacterium]|nr:PD-(D/E)XK nuclease family protein [Pseudomonadales bacterium]